MSHIPKRVELASLKQEIGHVDMFVGCLSYEPRSNAALNAITDGSGPESILFYNEEVVSSIDEVSSQLGNSVFVKKNKLRISDPLFSADVMLSILAEDQGEDGGKGHLVVDITTFTREHLLILLKIIEATRSKWLSIRLIYTPAKEMSHEWLSRGIKEYRSILGYPGDMAPTKKLHLVVMMGFEVERARCIIDSYEPELISIGIGGKDESISPELYSENRKFVDQLVGYYGDSVREFSFSLRDPLATCQALENHIALHPGFNTVIAPMNTKVSTIGAGLFAIANESVQLCYSEPSEYNVSQYSTTDDYCLIVPLFEE